MEDALRESSRLTSQTLTQRLNPYSDGRCSKSISFGNEVVFAESVLILILMEDALRAYNEMVSNSETFSVLILILMEDALRARSERS